MSAAAALADDDLPIDRNALVATAGRTIQQGSRSFHAASQLFDRETRERAWLLYSWCRHCDDVADGQELGRAADRPGGDVAALEDLTRRTLAGERIDQFPFLALAAVLRECPIPEHFLLDHLKGFALDAEGWRPQSEQDLVDYCYYVAGAVGCMMAIVMGVDARDDETLASASALGIAFQLANIARDVRDDREAGRCYLPADWLAEYGLGPQGEGDPEALGALVQRMMALADRYEVQARGGMPRLPFRARWAVMAAARIYGAIGKQVVSLGTAAWDERVVIRRRSKLRFLLSSFVEALRTRDGDHDPLRDHRAAADRPLPPAVPPRRRADRARASGDLRPSS